MKDHVLHIDPSDLHLGQLELDELQFGDGFTPQGALLGVFDAESLALVDDAERQRGDTDTFEHKSGLGTLAAAFGTDLLRLAEEPILVELHVVEEQFARGRRHDAHLLERLALGEALHALVEDKGQDLALAPLDR